MKIKPTWPPACPVNPHTQQPWTYEEWVASPGFQQMRVMALKRFAHQCALCTNERALEVHHRSYDRGLGMEWITDLVVLCEGCHKHHHATMQLKTLAMKFEESQKTIKALEARQGVQGVPESMPF